MAFFGGKAIAARTEDVEVGRDAEGNPVRIRLTAPGLFAVQNLRRDLKKPTAPATGKEAKRDDRGNPVRDEKGHVVREADETDPTYLEELAAWQSAQGLAGIFLAAGDSIELERTKREDFDTAVEFYLAAWRELEEDGVGVAEFRELSAAATRLVNISEGEIAGAREALEGKSEESKADTA